MILLGVTGSIAAYKAVEILRGFTKAGHDVRVIMTPAATRFVGPLTFQGLSGHPVLTDGLDAHAYSVAHLELAEQAAAIVVAPASAETLSRLARGSAEDLVSAVLLSAPRAKKAPDVPIFVAPAMHAAMWRHPATQANVRIIQSYGYRILGPENGALGRAQDSGEGRLIDPQVLIQTVLKAIKK
jgi:phosphopantothenoylcysteine decarboxylase/phosphopantothenate--cysteine ligase